MFAAGVNARPTERRKRAPNREPCVTANPCRAACMRPLRTGRKRQASGQSRRLPQTGSAGVNARPTKQDKRQQARKRVLAAFYHTANQIFSRQRRESSPRQEPGLAARLRSETALRRQSETRLRAQHLNFSFLFFHFSFSPVFIFSFSRVLIKNPRAGGPCPGVCVREPAAQPSILMRIPAATAEPMTPATLGPMACISR